MTFLKGIEVLEARFLSGLRIIEGKSAESETIPPSGLI